MIKTIPTATLRKRIEEIEQLLFKGEYICLYNLDFFLQSFGRVMTLDDVFTCHSFYNRCHLTFTFSRHI